MSEVPRRVRYNFHGVSIGVTADSAELLGLIASRLSAFPSDTKGSADIEFKFAYVSPEAERDVIRPAEAGRPVYEPPEGFVRYVDADDHLHADYSSRVRVLADVPSGRVTVSIREASPRETWLPSHPFFTLPLVEMLKRHGLFSVHAGGVASDGRAVLLAGASGAGKSTLTLALLEGGFEFLGDDMAFLRRRGDKLEVLAFPDEIDVTEKTVALFPAVRARLIAQRTGWQKRQVLSRDVSGAGVAWNCKPGIVVFPNIVDLGRSRVFPMPRELALLELAPNVLLTEPRSSQAHLDALGQLVRQSECYRLETGRDLHAVPDLVRELLERA